MHSEISSLPGQLFQLLHAVQEDIFIKRYGAVWNRQIQKTDSGCLAFERLTTQPKLMGFFVGQHRHENLDTLLRQRTNFVAEPVVATRASNDGNADRCGSGNGEDGGSHGNAKIPWD